MQLKEFMTIVKYLKTAFPDNNFLATQDAVNVWFMALSDLPIEVAQKAAVRVIQTCKFTPKIADFREASAMYLQDTKENGMSEQEAWLMVFKAMKNGIYGSKEEFEKLPPIIQKAVGSHENIKEMAMSDNGSLTVLQSNFLRSYRAVTARTKSEQALPPELRLGGANESKYIPEQSKVP